MRRPAFALGSSAALAAGIDLAVKAAWPAALHHQRSAPYALVAAAAVPWAAALLLTGSRLVAAAGGVLLGGALANVASLALWPAGVPDPLVAGGIAFNPADVFALAGGLLLVPLAVAVFAAQNRARLGAPLRLR